MEVFAYIGFTFKNILLVNDINDDAETFVLVLNAISNKIRSTVEESALEALKKLQDSKLSPDITLGL